MSKLMGSLHIGVFLYPYSYFPGNNYIDMARDKSIYLSFLVN